MYSTEEKRALVHRAAKMAITLDGKPATIGGYMLDFAGVRQLDRDCKGRREEYSWETVERVLDRDGKFRS